MSIKGNLTWAEFRRGEAGVQREAAKRKRYPMWAYAKALEEESEQRWADFERSERFGFACGALLFFGFHGLFWGWVTFGFGFGDGDGPDILPAFVFSAHVAALIACAAVVGMNWPSREEWRDAWRHLLAPREKTPDYNRVKDELVYVRGQYRSSGELVPRSADELAIRKTAFWAILLFEIIFIGGGSFALDAGKDYAPPLWLSVAMIVIGFTGAVLVVRVRDLAERVQGDLDRANALARSRRRAG